MTMKGEEKMEPTIKNLFSLFQLGFSLLVHVWYLQILISWIFLAMTISSNCQIVLYEQLLNQLSH